MGTRSEWTFLQRKYKIGQYADDKLLNVISHWETPIKIIVRYYFTPTWMAKIK